jgi:uncharacterized membrane protein
MKLSEGRKSVKAMNSFGTGKSAKSMLSSAWNDQRLEVIIGNLLRAGVLLSASVVVIGGIIYVARHGSAIVDYRNFQGKLSPLRTFTGIFHGTLQLSGRAIIQFGLLLLIATPVARVIFSAIGFVWERDYLYVAFTLAVLAVLCYSLFGGSLHG